VATLLHILRYKFIASIKTIFDMRTVSVVRGTGSLLVFGAFSFAAYILSHSITQFVLEHTRIGLYLYHQFISMMLFVLFMSVNLGNIIVSYSTLYRSPEVGFLFTKPVPFTSIFLLKFFDNFWYSSTTLFLVAFMALLGYGNYFGYPWYFFAGVMLFVLIPFMFLAACLAVLILLAIMKLAGRIGFRKVMTGIFALYFFFIFLFFKSSNPIQLVEEVNRHFANADTYLAQLAPGFLRYLPNQWIAKFLFFLARGQVSDALPFAGLLLAVTLAAFLLCILVAKKFYYRSWLISLQVQSMARLPYHPARKRFIDFRSGRLLPPQLDALLKKEYFLFLREPAQWIHLLVMIVLTVSFAFSASHVNITLRVVQTQILTYLTLFAFGGFMVASVSLRFAFPMLGLEGKSFWVLRSAPITNAKLYTIKFILVFVPVLLLAEYIAVSSNVPFVVMSARLPILMWAGIFNAFWMSLAMVSLNLGLGGYFANYLERNPIRAASSQGATLAFLVCLLYLFLFTVIVLPFFVSYLSSLFVFQQFQFASVVLPGTLIAVVSYIVTAASVVVGVRSLQRDF
jgi:ABC-2 type transport system permease protein